MTALSFFVEGKPTLSSKESSDIVHRDFLDVYYFYGEGCPHCANVKPFLDDMEEKYPLNLLRLDIYNNRSSLSFFDDLCNKYGPEHRGVPALFVCDTYFVGDTPIIDGFEDAVIDAFENSTPTMITIEQKDTSNQELVTVSNVPSILTITAAGLVDSISPCSIAILIFLIGARALVNRKKRILRVGLVFCLSVFIAYFLFGLGLLRVAQFSGFSGIFSLLVGLVAVFAGLFYLKDVFWKRKWGFAMEVPGRLKPVLTKMLKGVTSPTGAFLMGFVAVCFELPCTGGPYLFILGRLADSTTSLQVIPLLIYYNFIFVLPLIIVSLLLYSNIFSIRKAREWNESSKGILRFVGGSTMIALGFSAIPSSKLTLLFRTFLGCCRVALPPILFIFSVYLALSFFYVSQTKAKRHTKMTLLVTLPILSILINPLLIDNIQLSFSFYFPDVSPLKSDFSTIASYNTLIVDGSGEGNYTNLAEALENVTDPTDSNRWKIIIRPSNTSYVEDWSRLYNASKPYVEILGDDRESVVIEHSGSSDYYDREGLRLLPGMVISNLTIDCNFVRDSAALIMGRWNNDPADWPEDGNYNMSKVNILDCPYGGSTVVTYRSRDQNYLAPGEHHFYVRDTHYNYNETRLTSQEKYENEMFKAWGHSWKVQPDPGYTPSVFLHYENIQTDIVELRHEVGNHGEQTCLALIVHCSECSYEEASNYMKVNQFVFLDGFNCSYYAPDFQYYIFNPWEVRNDFGNFDPPLAYDTINFTDSFWEIVINVDFQVYSGTVTVEDLSYYVHADGDLNFIDEGVQRGNRFIIEGGSGPYRCEYVIWIVNETTLTLDKRFGEGYWCADDLGTGTNAEYRIGKSHSTNMGMTPSADPSRPEIDACYVRDFQFLVYDPDEGLNQIPERRDGLGGYPRGLTANWIQPQCDSENVYSNIWSFIDPPSTLPGPEIILISPENRTYPTSTINLTFSIDGPAYWMGYILDKEPVRTISGNTTLTSLSPGPHCLTVFARNSSTNMGSSSACFSVLDSIHDVAVVNVVPSKTIVGQGLPSRINVTAANQGDYTESFNVTTYFDETAITLPDGKNYTTVTLTGGNSTIITFLWNTTDVPYDSFILSAEADAVVGEVEVSDNTYTDGNVLVTFPGDVNGDRVVNALDLNMLAEAYGMTHVSPEWNPNIDIDNDELVGISDMHIMCANWNQSLDQSVELYYDDGVVDSQYGTSTLPHYKAVRFHSPTEGTYRLLYAKYYIASDPASFELQIRDSSAQIIHSEVVEPTEAEWFVVDLIGQDVYVEDDFYIAIKYLTVQQPKLGADYTDPDLESGEGTGFPAPPNLSSLDWMIRAVIEKP